MFITVVRTRDVHCRSLNYEVTSVCEFLVKMHIRSNMQILGQQTQFISDSQVLNTVKLVVITWETVK